MQHIRPREIRLRLGLSQERFAQRLGVSLQTVRRWESGLSRPLPIIAQKLLELERQTAPPGHSAGGVPMSRDRAKSTGTVEIGLGGLFKGIGSLLDLVSKMAEEGKDEQAGGGQVEALGGRVKGVYGFSVRMGLGGKPFIESFGNIQETEAGPVPSDSREPLVDVLDEGKALVLIAELPGIEETDIRLEVKGDILEISAATRDRQYHKEVLLPSAVAPRSLKSSYRNGILEVSLAKA